MQTALRRTGTMAPVIHHPDEANPAVPLRKSVAIAPESDRHSQEREPEALTAALFLGALVLTLLTSLAMRLFLG